MKKFIAILTLLVFLTSCGSEKIQEVLLEKTEKTKYKVGLKENNFINIYGNIVNNSRKVIAPNISGKISYINCEEGNRVDNRTLIAKIEPNYDGINYQNTSSQKSSLLYQIQKLNEIKEVTNKNFEIQKKQVELQRNEIENSRENIYENIGNEDNGIRNQIKITEESIELSKKNRKEKEQEVENNLNNLRKNIYNTLSKSSARLDETFGITNKNKNSNSSFETYLGAKNNLGKAEVKKEGEDLIEFKNSTNSSLSNLKDNEIPGKLEYFSKVFKKASDVLNDSLASTYFPQERINTLFNEFLGYSDGFIKYKNNFESLMNSKDEIKTNFDIKQKELEAKKSNLLSQEKSLKNKEKSMDISEKNIDEKISNIEEMRKTKIKELELQILSAEQNLKSLGINQKGENLYAEVSGIIKSKILKDQGAQVQIGTPICEIIPENNSLKLEIFSPEKLNIGEKFNYYKDGEKIGTGEITKEYPERLGKTQNYVYEGKINFGELKVGEYLDIKILKPSQKDEIWIDLKYVYPKLDGYYVNKVVDNKVTKQKVEVGNMNNGEIKIISGIKKGDILEE